MAQLNKGTVYSTVNSTVTIDNLNQLVDNATLLPGAISEQIALSGNATPASDQLLMLVSNQLKKATVVEALGGVTPTELLNRNNNLSDLTDLNAARTTLSINNVENKSSAVIRGEITSANVTTALGYTPPTTAQLTSAVQSLYPVGSVYINASNSTNPATLFGFGTWAAVGQGRVLLGNGTDSGVTYTAGSTGGSKDAIVVAHTHTATSVDSGHTHSVTQQGGRNTSDAYQNGPNSPFRGEASATLTTSSGAAQITTTIASTGSSGTNANMPPYLVVYMWQRTA